MCVCRFFDYVKLEKKGPLTRYNLEVEINQWVSWRQRNSKNKGCSAGADLINRVDRSTTYRVPRQARKMSWGRKSRISLLSS